MERKPPIQERPIETQWICAVLKNAAYESLTPKMQMAAIKNNGLEQEYFFEELNAEPEEVPGLIQEFLDPKNRYRGISVGNPHKLAVIPFLKDMDDAAKAIGAVNTMVVQYDGDTPYLYGSNTDWLGIYNPLVAALQDKGETLKGKKVAILGAGGAARGAVYAALQGEAQVKVFNRTKERAVALQEDFPDIEIAGQSEEELAELAGYDVILHLTNVGKTPTDTSLVKPEYMHEGQIVFECVYSAAILETDLTANAKARGATTLDGRDMLLHQGIPQFERYTHTTPPVEVMRQVVRPKAA